VNPYNGEEVPLWIADYVLWNYGTWAVMAVPDHDVRDHEFAKKFNLEIRESILAVEWRQDIENRAYTKDWLLTNSWDFDMISSADAREKFSAIAELGWFGHKKINYKLRDWLFSRQRYWGEPIPLVHCEKCWIVWEKEENLPILLPETDNFEPSGDGTSPLTQIPEFVNCKCPSCDWPGKRETNTMPQWGGSCWYYLRFMDPKNQDALVGKDAEKYWGSVDSYVGGAEHAVLHLLYARFWHKFLFDIGVVSTNEPFYRLRNQGMILGMSFKNIAWKLIASDMVQEKDWKFIDRETGDILEKIPAKMSKSLKNVVNPDEIVEQYGADTLRLYEMYMWDFADTKPWDTKSIIGLRRYLDKVYAIFIEGKERSAASDEDAMKMLHKTIKKVGNDIENYKFNTAIAQMMICLNTGLPKNAPDMQEWKIKYIQLLHPFAPHMAEEIWEAISEKKKPLLKVYFATGNDGKIKRAQSVFDTLKCQTKLEKIPELIDVEETGTTPMDCAMQKIEAYRDRGYTIPVMAADTAVYFENQDFEPTHVRRCAIQASWKDESELSKQEIAECMIEFYASKAKTEGWEVPFYYIDAFVVLFPNGDIKRFEYKREYILTGSSKGDIYPDAPMRSLYISKTTWKRAHETTMQDYIKEFGWQGEAFQELFSLNGNSIFFTSWPEYDDAMTIDSEITIWVQVLWKLRGEIKISKDEDKESVLAKAKQEETVMKWLEWKEIVKEIYVPGKIVNIVVK
jgi:leucyl-tRNA synthetase